MFRWLREIFILDAENRQLQSENLSLRQSLSEYKEDIRKLQAKYERVVNSNRKREDAYTNILINQANGVQSVRSLPSREELKDETPIQDDLPLFSVDKETEKQIWQTWQQLPIENQKAYENNFDNYMADMLTNYSDAIQELLN